MQEVGAELLLQEWKENVALYIDQDKRGLERLKVFLTIQAGLLALYGLLWQNGPEIWSTSACGLLSSGAIFLSVITHKMMLRAHTFVILRRLQGMYVEQKLAKLSGGRGIRSVDGKIITTFAHENSAFRGKNYKCSDPLLKEIEEIEKRAPDVLRLRGKWSHSIYHLTWLKAVFISFYVLWPALLALILLRQLIN